MSRAKREAARGAAVLVAVALAAGLLSGCTASSRDDEDAFAAADSPVAAEGVDNAAAEPTVNAEDEMPGVMSDDAANATAVTMAIGSQAFSVTLADSDTVHAFAALLPAVFSMSELNGNEKYVYLDESLPSNASNPGDVREGDLMLYGDSCVVLFYESFSTSYSYTRIGRVDDDAGLAEALGSGSVDVSFEPR